MIRNKRFLGALLGLALLSACGGSDRSYNRERGYTGQSGTGSGTERMQRDDKGDSSTTPSSGTGTKSSSD
jgi:hypothetical protein